MNTAFLPILTVIKNALRVKKFKLSVKLSKPNIIFLDYLLKQGFITSYIKKNNKLHVFFKYGSLTTSALFSSSFCSKRSRQNYKTLKKIKSSNFIQNLVENKNSKLLARFQ